MATNIKMYAVFFAYCLPVGRLDSNAARKSLLIRRRGLYIHCFRPRSSRMFPGRIMSLSTHVKNLVVSIGIPRSVIICGGAWVYSTCFSTLSDFAISSGAIGFKSRLP